MKPALLIADTDARLTSLYANYLSGYGYEALTATTALECWNVLRAGEVDLAVLNPEIPWGGGGELLECLRQTPDMRAVPVILLLGKTDVVIPREFMGPPIVHCLRKPLRLAKLTGIITQTLASAIELSRAAI